MIDQFKRLHVQLVRRAPLPEFHLRTRWEKERKLTPFRTNPKTILASKQINLGFDFAALNSIVIDPAVTEALIALRRGGHRAALPIRNHDYFLVGGIFQNDRLHILLYVRKVVSEIFVVGCHGTFSII